MTSQVRLIICERKGLWAAVVRRTLPREIMLRETRSLAECHEELAMAPASLLAVEISPGRLPELLDLLADAGRSFPLARVVAMAPRDCQAYEWLLREAGVVHFATSPRTAAAIARLAVRHAARVPRPRTTFAAQIWESLPWPEAATS